MKHIKGTLRLSRTLRLLGLIWPTKNCSPILKQIPAERTIKVGLLTQAPVGNGGSRIYENLSIEKKAVKNIRAGK